MFCFSGYVSEAYWSIERTHKSHAVALYLRGLLLFCKKPDKPIYFARLQQLSSSLFSLLLPLVQIYCQSSKNLTLRPLWSHLLWRENPSECFHCFLSHRLGIQSLPFLIVFVDLKTLCYTTSHTGHTRQGSSYLTSLPHTPQAYFPAMNWYWFHPRHLDFMFVVIPLPSKTVYHLLTSSTTSSQVSAVSTRPSAYNIGYDPWLVFTLW